MRIYITTTASTETVPFDYQRTLVGAMHKWIGDNDIHDDLSLYSLSWLEGGIASNKGIKFPEGATFFISSPNTELHQRIVNGVFSDPTIRWGLKVKEVRLQVPPSFSSYERLILQSPVLIKRNTNSKIKFYFPQDTEANLLLTDTLVNKLSKANMQQFKVSARFDPDYYNPKTKLVTYNGIHNKATFCPILLEGDPEAIQFAWSVGMGNCTGIGFGAVV